MSFTIPYNINFTSNHGSVFGEIDSGLDKTGKKVKTVAKSFGDGFKELLSFSIALEGIQQLETGLESLISPAAAFNAEMVELNAITGLADEGLEKIEKSARKSAVFFGTSASSGVESYKILLSKLSPEIAQNSEALAIMGQNVGYTSKLMQGDSVAATGVLTTAMNQYGVSLKDPLEASKQMGIMMNIMAAGAKEGSAELPDIAAGLENAGLMAKTANVSFAETNAALQILDKAGKKRAEGGVALRNVLSTLSLGEFLPKDVRVRLQGVGIDIRQLSDVSIPLSERLSALEPIMNNTALVTKLFGKENSAAALALIQNIKGLEELTPKLIGTNTAVEQAETIMSSYIERGNRWDAQLTDIKLSFFNLTESILPFVQHSFSGVVALGQLAFSAQALNSIWIAKNELLSKLNFGWLTNLKTSSLFNTNLNRINIQMGIGAVMSRIQSVGLKSVAISFGQATLGAVGFQIALDALGIGLIIAGVALLVSGIKHLWDNSKKFHEILGYIGGVGKAVFHNIGVYVGRLWEFIIKPIGTAWLSFYKSIFLGVWDVAKSVWDGIGSIVSYSWENILKPVASGIYDFYSFVFTSVWETVTWVWNGITEVGAAVWDWFSSTFSQVAAFISQVIIEPIKAAFSGVWEWLSNLLDNLFAKLDGLLAPIRALWNKIFSSEGTISVHQSGLDAAKKAGEDFEPNKQQEQQEKNPITGFAAPTTTTLGGSVAKQTILKQEASKGSAGTSGQRAGNLTIHKLVETINIHQSNNKTTQSELVRMVKEALLTAQADFTLAT